MRKVQALVAALPFGTSLLGALFVSALFFSTLFLSTTAIASTVLYEHRLPPGFGQIVPDVSYFLDPSGDTSLDDVLKRSFEKVREYPPQFGYTDAAVWLTFKYRKSGGYRLAEC